MPAPVQLLLLLLLEFKLHFLFFGQLAVIYGLYFSVGWNMCSCACLSCNASIWLHNEQPTHTDSRQSQSLCVMNSPSRICWFALLSSIHFSARIIIRAIEKYVAHFCGRSKVLCLLLANFINVAYFCEGWRTLFLGNFNASGENTKE